ncbi:MAG TPA: GntR family transcriptional regulator [Capillimicrobium sp.]
MPTAPAPPTIAQIEHVDLNEKVYEQLRGALLSGSLRAGSRVNLASLADQLGVSRSPIHQALTRLAAEGFLKVRSRRGYEVTPVTPAAVDEEYDVRLALELFAADQTVGRLDVEQLAGFEAALQRTLEPLDAPDGVDLHAFIATNQTFHRRQLDFAANATMTSLYGNLRVTMLMERLLAALDLTASTAAAMRSQHVDLYESFAAGDRRAAKRVIRAHVELGRELAMEAIEQAGGEA